jgi:hypothetical protein
MSSAKTSQIIWLDSKTLANITYLYVQSGADQMMALNQFITKILTTVTQNEEILKMILKELYTAQPSLKQYSFFVERIEIEKPVYTSKFTCPWCLAEFKDAKSLKEHFYAFEKVIKQ